MSQKYAPNPDIPADKDVFKLTFHLDQRKVSATFL
jgi:hypothetical protein